MEVVTSKAIFEEVFLGFKDTVLSIFFEVGEGGKLGSNVTFLEMLLFLFVSWDEVCMDFFILSAVWVV
ncbi:MAG: hypothetical protein V4487_06870 [Chlamydiota bacterium]